MDADTAAGMVHPRPPRITWSVLDDVGGLSDTARFALGQPRSKDPAHDIYATCFSPSHSQWSRSLARIYTFLSTKTVSGWLLVRTMVWVAVCWVRCGSSRSGERPREARYRQCLMSLNLAAASRAGSFDDDRQEVWIHASGWARRRQRKDAVPVWETSRRRVISVPPIIFWAAPTRTPVEATDFFFPSTGQRSCARTEL